MISKIIPIQYLCKSQGHHLNQVLRFPGIIENMGLEEYDPYAIRSYSFTVRKTNSFFSFPTVILSILIIGFSVLINLNTVQHLWLPFKELEVKAASSLEMPEQLTYTLLCSKPSVATNKNRLSIMRANHTQVLFPIVTEEEVAIIDPTLSAQIGSGFSCLNMAGLQFSNADEYIYIEVQDPSATIYLKGISLEATMNGLSDQAITLASTNARTVALVLELSFIKITKEDRLYLNYDPEVINTVKTQTNTGTISHNFTGNFTYFSLAIYHPGASVVLASEKNNHLTVNILRKNLGQILGAVISWASILLILFGFIAAPLMDHKLNIITAQTLFHLEPNMRNPSLLKYLIATVKPGLFPKQDRFVKMCEQIEKMKDVGTIVKLQMLFSRLIPKSRRKSVQELIASQYSFNQVAKNEVGVDLYTEQGNSQPLTLDLSEDEKAENCLTSLRKKLLYFLDAGSDSISIAYNKKGIGSKRSLCITITFTIGLLAFLIVFGILQSQTTVKRFETKQPQQLISFPANSLFFAVLSNNSPVVTVLDGNYNTIETLTLSSGSACTPYLTATQLTQLQTKGSNIRCIPKALDLIRSADKNAERFINFDVVGTGINSAYFLYFKQDQTIPFYTNLDKIMPMNFNSAADTTYYELPVTIVKAEKGAEEHELYQFNTLSFKSNTFANSKIGIIVKVSEQQLTIQEETSDIFEAIQNIWTFTIVCFTIIVMKLTKYVNLSEKQQSKTAERADFRDSICILLAKIDGLLRGRHRGELEELKHYTKPPIPST